MSPGPGGTGTAATRDPDRLGEVCEAHTVPRRRLPWSRDRLQKLRVLGAQHLLPFSADVCSFLRISELEMSWGWTGYR